MDIIVCKECGKLKKSQTVAGETRIDGKKISKMLRKWIKKNIFASTEVRIKEVSCMKQCKKGPVIYIKDQKEFFLKLSKESLKDFFSKLEKQLNTKQAI